MKTLLRFISILIFLGILLLPRQGQSQGLSQVTLFGIPPVLPDPSVSGLASTYQNGDFMMILNYTAPGNTPVDFRFRVRLEKDGTQIFDLSSEPVRIRPGSYQYQRFDDFPQIVFQETVADVMDILYSRFQNASTLPEGDYILEIEALTDDPSRFISSVPGIASFRVEYADPPFLLTPSEGELITPDFPNFSWTPVAGLPSGSFVEYHLKIVEVLPGQFANEAMEANRPQLETTVTGPTTFTYGAEQLPLNPHSTYAWQVRAETAGTDLPFTNEGLTEIYTFTVMESEFEIVDLFSWRYPFGNPIFDFDIPDAHISTESARITGRHSGYVAGARNTATFDELLINQDDFSVAGGLLTFDYPFLFEGEALPDGTVSSIQLHPAGKLPEREAGFTIEPGIVQFGADGFRGIGHAKGSLRFGGMDIQGLDVNLSPDFRIQLFGSYVSQGRATFSVGGAVVATLDPTGLSVEDPSGVDMVTFIPDQSPMPAERVAYLKLKEGTTAYVEASMNPDGTASIHNREGYELVAVFQVFPGSPEVPVQLQNVVIDPVSGEIISGRLDSHTGEIEDLLVSEQIPFRFTGFEFSADQGLHMAAKLHLFGQTLPGSSVTLALSETGIMSGEVFSENLNHSFPLTEHSNKAVLHLQNVLGSLQMDLMSSMNPYFSFDMDAQLLLQDGDETIVGSRLSLNYNSTQKFRLDGTGPDLMSENPEIDTGAIKLGILEFTSFDLNYTPATGFDFNIKLNSELRLELAESSLTIPLGNIELNETGFSIPARNIHSGSTTTELPEFETGPVNLKLLAMRLPAFTFGWFDWQAGESGGFDPSFDFEVNFPGFKDRAESLANATVTLQNARFDGEFLTGSLLPYTPAGGSINVPIGPETGIQIREIEGSLYRDGDTQGADITMASVLQAPGLFTEGSPECKQTVLELKLAEQGRFIGRTDNFDPCGELDAGGVMMTLNEAYMEFGVIEESQTLEIGGNMTARTDVPFFGEAAADGEILFDVPGRRIISSDVIFPEWVWKYPAAAPVIEFHASDAMLTGGGIGLDGSGEVSFGDSTATVEFSELMINKKTGNIEEGSVFFAEPVSIMAGINPATWILTDQTELDPDDTNKLLLVPEAGGQLNKDGYLITGSGTSSVNIGGVFEQGLTVDFQDLSVGFQPAGVRSGEAEISSETERVAWIDTDGIHMDNHLAFLPVPERLALPSESIAYLQLHDEEGNILAELGEVSEDGRTRPLRTTGDQTVQLVLMSLATEDTIPVFDTSFDLFINPTTYEITGGSIELDLSGSSYSLSDSGLPFELTKIRFSNDSGAYKLTAGVDLTLPDVLQAEGFPLGPELAFSENGFREAEIQLGSYSLTKPDEVEAFHSVTAQNEAFSLHLNGIRISVGETGSFRVSGDYTSKMIRDSSGVQQPLHFYSNYDSENSKWNYSVDISHLPGNRIPLHKAYLEQNESMPLSISASDDEFSLMMGGVLTLPGLGENFALYVEQIEIGTGGTTINTDETTEQQFSLFGGFLMLQVSSISANFNDDDLFINMGGSLKTMIEQQKEELTETTSTPVSFSDMRIGTNGSFAMGQGDVNLLGETEIHILDDIFWLNNLVIGFENNQLNLAAGGIVDLPVPGGNGADKPDLYQSEFSFNINSRGETEGNAGLNFKFDANAVPNYGNSETEINFGDAAAFEITAAAIDFNPVNPAETTLYASMAFHVKSRTGGTKDSAGRDRVIILGNANNVRENYGLKHTFSDTEISLNVDVNGTEENPLFTFDAGMMILNMTRFQISEFSDFEMSMKGTAALNLDAVSGTFGFEEYTIGRTGVTNWGRPTGQVSVDVMNVVALSIGTFDFQVASEEKVNLERTRTIDDGNGGEITEIYSIPVNEYVMLTDISITLGAEGEAKSFSGSVEEVLFYRDDDLYSMTIREAEMSLGDQVMLYAGFQLDVENDEFLLRVQGVGRIGDKSVGAVGKISTLDGKLSFGIFVAGSGFDIDMLAPIAPRTLIFNGIGGGIFYRPDKEDFDAVIATVSKMDSGFKVNNPNGLPVSDGQEFLFSVMLYANGGLIGSSGKFVVDASIFLVITEQFASVDLNGTIIGQDDESLPTLIKAGAYLTIQWPGRVFSGVRVEGGVSVEVEYPLVTGAARIDFMMSATMEGVVWGMTGNMEINLIDIITIDGNMYVNQSGFLLNLRGKAEFEVSIITVSSQMELAFWFHEQTKSLGAYTQFTAEASFLGGLAEVGIQLKGAFVTEPDDFLIYAMGSGYVRVIGVFEGSKSAWVAFRHNDGLKAGLGRNEQYETLIANSRNQSLAMKKEAEAMQAELLLARLEPYKIDAETLFSAAINIRLAPIEERRAFKEAVLSVEESHIIAGQAAVLDQVRVIADEFFEAADQPEISETESYLTQLESSLETFETSSGLIEERLNEVNLEYANYMSESTVIEPMQSPVQVNSDGVFFIDEDEAGQQQTMLARLSEENDRLHQEYLDDLAESRRVLQAVDELMLTSGGIEDIVAASKELYESLSLYHAMVYSYHSNSIAWTHEKTARYHDIRDQIRRAFNNTSYSQNVMISNMQEIINLAAERYQLIKTLASAEDREDGFLDLDENVDLSMAANEYRTELQSLANDGLYNFINMELREKGIFLWLGIPQNSMIQYERIQRELGRQNTANFVFGDFLEMRDLSASIAEKMANMYAIKSKMIEIHASKINEYLNWTGNAVDESLAAELRAERNKWALSLEPAQVDHYSASVQRHDTYSTVHYTWEVSHPSGESAGSILGITDSQKEYSSLDPGTIYVPAGYENELAHHTFSNRFYPRGSGSVDINDVKTDLLVRSPGGTLTRVEGQSLRVSVLPEGDNRGDINTGILDGIDPENHEAPTQPQIIFSRLESPDGYWTNSSTRLEFIAGSQDPYGQTLTFEYAIGTENNPESIREWSLLTGGIPLSNLDKDQLFFPEWREVNGYVISSMNSPNDRLFTIDELQLENGGSYLLSVRARNSYNTTGIRSELPFRVDTGDMFFHTGTISAEISLPPPPAEDTGFMVTGMALLDARPPVNSGISSAEDFLNYSGTGTALVPKTEIQLTWPEAAQMFAPVMHYEVAMARSDNPTQAFADSGTIIRSQGNRATFPGDIYDAPYYIFVKATSYSGDESIHVSGPYDPLPSSLRPSIPQATAGYLDGNLMLWITLPGRDEASGIAGYQYAIGHKSGLWTAVDGHTQFREWPVDGEPDFAADDFDIPLEPADMLAPGYILDIEPEEIETALPVVFYVRAVNTQGLPSNTFASSGILDLPDTTPPIIGEFQPEYMKYQSYYTAQTDGPQYRPERLQFTARGITDPGSGIQSVHLLVEDENSGEQLYEQIQTIEEPERYRGNDLFFGDFFEGWNPGSNSMRLAGRKIRATLSVVNGKGLETTIQEITDLSMPDMPEPGLYIKVTERRRQLPQLEATITNLNGYTAGIKRIEIRLEDNATGEEIYPWTDTHLEYEFYPTYGGPYYRKWSLYDEEFGGRPIRAIVRVTNIFDEQVTAEDVWE